MPTTASNIFVYRMFLINTKKAPKMVGWLLLLLVVVVKWYFGGWIIHPNCKYMIIIQKRKEVWKNWIKLTTTLVMPPFVQSKSSCVVFQKMQALVLSMHWNDKGITCWTNCVHIDWQHEGQIATIKKIGQSLSMGTRCGVQLGEDHVEGDFCRELYMRQPTCDHTRDGDNQTGQATKISIDFTHTL